MGPKWALLARPTPAKCRMPLDLLGRRLFQQFQDSLVAVAGPIARGLSLVAIVLGGLMMAIIDSGDHKRMIGGIILGVGMAISAANFLVWVTGG